MSFNNLKIGTKLVGGIFLLLLVSCGGIGWLSYRSASSSLQKSIEESLPTLATESGKYVRLVLDHYMVSVESVANRNVIRSMDWQKQKPALEEEAKRVGCQGMGVVGLDGLARFSDGSQGDVKDREYFRIASGGKTTISDMIVSRDGDSKPVIVVATPIHALDGATAGVLCARFDGLFLSDITKQIKYGKKGYSYIIDGKGALIAHNKREFVEQQKNFYEEGKTKPEYRLLSKMMGDMVARKTGFDQYYFTGSDKFFGYAPIPGTTWSLAVGAEKDEVFADIYSMRQTMLLVTGGFLIFGLLMSVLFARSVSRPVMDGVAHISLVGMQGDLSVDAPPAYLLRKDEIGELARAVQKLVEAQRIQAGLAKKIAGGDWDQEMPVRSEKDELAIALREMVLKMNATLQTVKDSAGQVFSGAQQIASASQSLSQGATESAASLQEISASMTEIGSQIKQNAENAQQANHLAVSARDAALKGSRHMSEMVGAMQEINTSSQQISKIIKTIDAIAFQTNLLALNAAVEAARAGRHGKGFAVVAEEVRNLAARSAKAAKETAELIETSGAKVGKGMEVASLTEKALEEIVEGIRKAADLVGEIAAASNEQAEGVSQVTIGLGQIDNVTQQNTANAEETASSTEELSGQARALQTLLAGFRLQGMSGPVGSVGGLVSNARGSTNQFRKPAEPAKQLSLPQRASEPQTIDPQIQIKLDDSEFGRF